MQLCTTHPECHPRYIDFREMVKGGYTPCFSAVWAYRRNARTEGVPTCPNLRQMQFRSPGKTPAAHAEHQHRLFFFGYVLGLNGTAALEGAKGFPLLTTRGGGISPQKSTKIIYSPRLTTICPQLTDNIPLFDHYDSLKSDYKMTSPRPRPKARIDHGQNIQKSRTVAIVCVRRNLGTTTRTYQIFIDEVKIYILFLENMMR